MEAQLSTIPFGKINDNITKIISLEKHTLCCLVGIKQTAEKSQAQTGDLTNQ